MVGSTASHQEDTHSHQVAAATLGAIAPAWLRSDKPISQLVAAVVALLPAMLPHRRLPLLTALLAVLPQVSVLCCCLCTWLCYHSVPVTVLDEVYSCSLSARGFFYLFILGGRVIHYTGATVVQAVMQFVSRLAWMFQPCCRAPGLHRRACYARSCAAQPNAQPNLQKL